MDGSTMQEMKHVSVPQHFGTLISPIQIHDHNSRGHTIPEE